MWPKSFLALTLFLTTSAALTLSACGGGGSDDDNGDFEQLSLLGGTWQGTLSLASDSCGNAAQTSSFVHQVSQNESAISLTTNDSTVYLGNTVANGFSVDAGAVAQNNCTVNRRIEYADVDDNDDNAASVEFTLNRVCTVGASTCQQSYTGTASRVSRGANPTPVATVVVTPGSGTPTVPVSGGCAAMNPNTIAGVYQGDGGCGLSEAKFTFGNQAGSSTVILNPFGANGATSFVISPANPATAGSVRTDLVIKGAADNSCSMVCSPPGTFTVSCIQEGGTTCREKF